MDLGKPLAPPNPSLPTYAPEIEQQRTAAALLAGYGFHETTPSELGPRYAPPPPWWRRWLGRG